MSLPSRSHHDRGTTEITPIITAPTVNEREPLSHSIRPRNVPIATSVTEELSPSPPPTNNMCHDQPLPSQSASQTHLTMPIALHEPASELQWHKEVVSAHISDEFLRFVYPTPHTADLPPRQDGQSGESGVGFLFLDIPPRGNRPLSSRVQEQEHDVSLFRSQVSASKFLDLTFICEEAYRKYSSTFQNSIWFCCQKACFATLCTGYQPRFFALVKSIHEEANLAREAITASQRFVSPRTLHQYHPSNQHSAGEYRTNELTVRRARENFVECAKKYLPFLLGKKGFEGVSGKLCICATKDVLGVSLSFIYRRRDIENVSSLIDLSGMRQRVHRRCGGRGELTPITELPNFKCGCYRPCLADADVDHLQSLFGKFAKISSQMRPYENENEYLIDFLFCPMSNTDIPYCDRSVAETLGVSSRRVARARRVVRDLIRNPALLLQERIAPTHGMFQYSSANHPMNRVSADIREAITMTLDMATRGDPSAADGSVTYRFLDPSVNTYEKFQKLLFRTIKERMGNDIAQQVGGLHSSTFRKLLSEFLAERDGRISFARADHNCCPHCQDLELAVSTFEMELGLIDETAVERRQACTKRLYEARTALEEHVSWDRKVRRHLANLVDRMKDLENISRVIAGGSTICPSWRSQKRLGLLTHQDEMSKPNIPHFTQDSLSDITRYRYDVTAHVSAITGDATVFSHEQGTGAKNSGAVFESILLDHLLTCKGQSVKIIWSDYASVGRSFFSCVATMQYLVDSGLCDLALSGYMANCHGKYLADSLFGQWNTRARNEDITSVDGLLHVFESIKRTGGAKVTGLVLNPISSVNWQANLARFGYAVSPPADFGWESMNPHYSCACKQSVRDSMPPELLTLLEPLMPKFENCVRVSSWPRFDEPTVRIPFNQRPIDVPAAAIRPSTANTATTASITGRVQSNGGPSVTRTRTEIAEDWYLYVIEVGRSLLAEMVSYHRALQKLLATTLQVSTTRFLFYEMT